MLNFLLVIDVLIAIGLIALILLQRGPGATTGAAFGSGASGTVFGARGSANFLSRTTAALAAAFFIVTLAMAMIAARSVTTGNTEDLGVMGAMSTVTQPAADTASGEGAGDGGDVMSVDAMDSAAMDSAEGVEAMTPPAPMADADSAAGSGAAQDDDIPAMMAEPAADDAEATNTEDDNNN